MKRAALDDIEEVMKAALEEDEKPKKQGNKGSFDDEKDRVRRMFKQKKPKLNQE
ncbi:MAG TPA: hypothetical protein PLS50_08635 [Candidatus Dojkabacteria bacterium]|nr:hypothetical protein [Candidatus Dojkabacteria bacterium]